MPFLDILRVLTVIAGALMSIGHFPQAYKIWRRKSAKDVSLVMYSFFCVGSYIWLAYGLTILDVPIMVSYGISVVGTTMALILILKYRDR